MNRSLLYEGLEADVVLEIMKYNNWGRNSHIGPFNHNRYYNAAAAAYSLGQSQRCADEEVAKSNLSRKAYRAIATYLDTEWVRLYHICKEKGAVNNVYSSRS